MVFKGRYNPGTEAEAKLDGQEYDVILPFLKNGNDGYYEVIDDSYRIYAKSGNVRLHLPENCKKFNNGGDFSITLATGEDIRVYFEGNATFTLTTDYLDVKANDLDIGIDDQLMNGTTIQVYASDTGYPNLRGTFDVTL